MGAVQAQEPQAALPGRQKPVGRMKAEEAGRLRRLAAQADRDHPETVVGGHLRDAARALERGQTIAATRHLAVARHTLTPQQLYRHGVTQGTDHTTARRNAGELDRRMLAIRDIHDMERDNLSRALEKRQQQQQVAERKAQPSPVTGTPMRPGEKGGPEHQAGGPPGNPKGPQARSIPMPPAPREPAYQTHTAELLHHVELSARTGMLATTPAPIGKPGGPGLYRVKGNKHSDYMEQVVKALMQKRGMPKDRAYRIAWAALRRWRAKSKHPEVQAAASGALVQEKAAAARAHAHTADAQAVREIFALAWQIADAIELATGQQAYTRHPDETVQCPVCHRWDAPDARFCDQCGNSLLLSKPGYKPKEYDAQGEGKGEPVTCPQCGQGDAADARFCDQCGHKLDTTAYRDLAGQQQAVELTGTAAGAAKDQRIAAGQAGGGQFGSGGGGGSSKSSGSGKQPSAHQQHMAHMTHLANVAATGKGTAKEKAQAKAMLEQKIKGEQAQLAALRKTLAGLAHSQKTMAKNTAKATKAGTTGKSASSTPAKKAQATTSGNPAAAAKKASSAASTTAGKTASASSKATLIRRQIAQLTALIATQQAQAAKL